MALVWKYTGFITFLLLIYNILPFFQYWEADVLIACKLLPQNTHILGVYKYRNEIHLN